VDRPAPFLGLLQGEEKKNGEQKESCSPLFWD
jgi:hypothetical protein